jgi:hypothetical protein
MGLLMNLLTFPVTGPIKGLVWIAETIQDEADKQFFSEESIRAQLMELEMKIDLGEISEDVYTEAETMLLQRLKIARDRRAAQTSR